MVRTSFTFSSWIPTAICRFVISVWIDSIEVIGLIWSFAHILKEVFKLLPALTDNDSTSTVVFERINQWVLASASHTLPTAIGKAWSDFLFCISTLSMSSGNEADNGFLETATTRNFAVSQMISANRFFSAAIAFTKPISAWLARGPFDYCEIPKGLTGQINHMGLTLEYW